MTLLCMWETLGISTSYIFLYSTGQGGGICRQEARIHRRLAYVFWLSMSIQSMPRDTLLRSENTRAKGLIQSPSSTGKAISTSLRRRRVSAEWGFPDVPATLDSPLMAANTSHKKHQKAAQYWSNRICVIRMFWQKVRSCNNTGVFLCISWIVIFSVTPQSKLLFVMFVASPKNTLGCSIAATGADRCNAFGQFEFWHEEGGRRRRWRPPQALIRIHLDPFLPQPSNFISRFSTKIFGQRFVPSKRITPWEHCQSLWKMWPGDAPKVWSWIQNCKMRFSKMVHLDLASLLCFFATKTPETESDMSECPRKNIKLRCWGGSTCHWTSQAHLPNPWIHGRCEVLGSDLVDLKDGWIKETTSMIRLLQGGVTEWNPITWLWPIHKCDMVQLCDRTGSKSVLEVKPPPQVDQVDLIAIGLSDVEQEVFAENVHNVKCWHAEFWQVFAHSKCWVAAMIRHVSFRYSKDKAGSMHRK